MKKLKYLFDDILTFLKNNKLIFITIFIIVVISLVCKTSVKAANTLEPQKIEDTQLFNLIYETEEYKSGNYNFVVCRNDNSYYKIVFIKKVEGFKAYIDRFGTGDCYVYYNSSVFRQFYFASKNPSSLSKGQYGSGDSDKFYSTGTGSEWYKGTSYFYSDFDIYTDNTYTTLFFQGGRISLELSVSSTDLTEFGVVIKTQTFSDEFLKTHKLYYSYPLADGINSKFMICNDGVTDGLTVDNYYRVWAIRNGAYKFRLTDLEDNLICSATMNITNIIESTQSATDNSVLLPILTYYIDNNNYVVVKTQDLSKNLINKYRCYFGSDVKTSGNKGVLELVAQEGDNNTFYFKASTDVDDTFYFQFYDTEMKKFSTTVSIAINVESAIAGASNNSQPKTMEALFKQKFGIFYSCFDFLQEFWNVITNKNPECPNFFITLPAFCGGGTYNIFDFQFYNQYRDYVHYIIAGFCYFFFIKRLVTDIPKII